MPRAQSWYRTQQFGEYLLTGPAAVLNLGSFTEGQTLARMHVDLSCVGDWYNGEGAVFEGPYEFVQTVIAFAFQQDPEGGVAPGGFFGGYDANWIMIRQIAWYNWPVIFADPTYVAYQSGFQNTTSTEAIDDKGQRLVLPGNGGTLYAVLDSYNINPDRSIGFGYNYQLNTAVLTMDAA